MAIIDNIKRLQDAKAAIKSTIESKGGSVSGTIDTYAASILALPSGGANVITGNATKKDTKNLQYSGLPSEPNYWAVMASANCTTDRKYIIMSACGTIGTGNRAIVMYRSQGGYTHTNITAAYTNGTITITTTGTNSATSGTFEATSYQLIAVC